jgi:hypothetical protein
MTFLRTCFSRNLLVASTVLLCAWAQAEPYMSTRYVRIDMAANTAYSYDQNFVRLPDNPDRPGTSQEVLPEGKKQWFLGADVDVVKRHADGTLEVVSNQPAYAQIPHHYIWRYVTDTRPAKDVCGILPLAIGRDLLDLRFPRGYAYSMNGGILGGIDFHWTNSANVPVEEELYVRFNMHWDEGVNKYRDFHITWVGLNPCREEVIVPRGKHVFKGAGQSLGETARIIQVAPHVMDHVDYLDVRINPDTAWRFDPIHAYNPGAHFGGGEHADHDEPSVPLHRHRGHIAQNAVSLWQPGIYGPIVRANDKISARLSVTNPHRQPIENSGILLVFWEPVDTSKAAELAPMGEEAAD